MSELISPSDPLNAGLLFFSSAYAGALLILTLHHAAGQRWPLPATLLAAYGSAGCFALVAGLGGLSLLPAVVFALISLIALRRFLRWYHPSGWVVILTSAQLLVVSIPWLVRFILTVPVSPLTRGLMLSALPVGFAVLAPGLVTAFEYCEVLCRDVWVRPRNPLQSLPRRFHPKVSFHIPVHAEPPDVVIATLDALDRLAYPNYEVLVVDNNTGDPGLWKPVRDHCRRLGGRYRFFHVGHLTGAKAGALNFALRQADPEAVLVSVVDADYQVEPDFLERLVGYFDDSGMGFVQTPHDYRAWQDSVYLRLCHWEYRTFFHTMLVSQNERTASMILGTMCLIRRSALEESGGWAEWCVTEDSELAIRIHALGYRSVYVPVTFGRGLIPPTFSGYKRQRFRWTYGPVQELKRHWRLFLPRGMARPSRLSWAQKINHLTHGLDPAALSLTLLFLPLGMATAGSMVVHREVIPVPFALWLLVTVQLLGGILLRLLVFRYVVDASLADWLRAALASKALSHTKALAGLRGLLTRTIAFVRTDKFTPAPSLQRAFSGSWLEALLAVCAFGFSAVAFGQLPRTGLLLMVLIGLILHGLRYSAAPIVAVSAELALWRESRLEVGQESPPGVGRSPAA